MPSWAVAVLVQIPGRRHLSIHPIPYLQPLPISSSSHVTLHTSLKACGRISSPTSFFPEEPTFRFHHTINSPTSTLNCRCQPCNKRPCCSRHRCPITSSFRPVRCMALKMAKPRCRTCKTFQVYQTCTGSSSRTPTTGGLINFLERAALRIIGATAAEAKDQ